MKIRKTRGEYPIDTVVLEDTVHFDENGVAEVEDITGEMLLEIPGYEEYKEKPKRGATQPPDDSKGKKDDSKGKQDPQAPDPGVTPPTETKE
ncbi:hypothetical protein G9G53_22655 [Paenibacillus sp. EKM206P]|uniref:hypothetical protein n=1 Tax=Paenibacillus sp. EKM206P TaxID=1683674 RepID=UPI0013EB7C0B|nr:hypothetical protein [Paenibacillus sp. EKM206P]KAF6569092.1 hypothetical protein G9G53_22655 [Paenibacillus sp. EKM206P]